MSIQNQVIIAIGSNVGDRLLQITTCIEKLHREVGTVVKTSRVYESPAVGFAGADFYNCVILIHTFSSSGEVLDRILQVELNMGRVRTADTGYESRTIDIDIIAFNEDSIELDRLTVPHPRMHQRTFVLLPFADLEYDWQHPVLNLSVTELLKQLPDGESCVPVEKLTAPLRVITLEKFNYIAIEGNIGAGKTTLTNRIAEDFNAKTVLERFADNPFLPKFYEDQHRYAFPLEMSFLADRYQQISDDLAQFDLFKDFIIADYHIFKSLIFAKITLTDDEYRLYRKLFEIIYKEMPKPDLYIYLYQNTERLLANIKQRGRSYEQDIPADYLDKINRGYLDYIKSQPDLNVLIIDVSDKDFVKNQNDYIFILDQISKNS
ncbi:MAG: 2-amino-4-hydroxy-6-hydroxymethyldihydropteridine diphosphokinase [Flavobacterium sp.]|nr:2-amino-4-hydroxy-6-hydroxymethyldihydropteridine diphosphokinase [Flavobacterium sp.]